ncbi:hypothetical protein NEPAR08_2531 [Nematocida parisii]|nr:hypothetical protein NEPAR08_2531 [Nematocida parisii]
MKKGVRVLLLLFTLACAVGVGMAVCTARHRLETEGTESRENTQRVLQNSLKSAECKRDSIIGGTENRGPPGSV